LFYFDVSTKIIKQVRRKKLVGKGQKEFGIAIAK
jgi:hypothetical protein